MRTSKLDCPSFADVVTRSTSVSAVLHHFGLSATGGNFATFNKKIKLLGLSTKHFDPTFFKVAYTNLRGRPKSIPDDQVFIENATISRGAVKKRLLRRKLVEEVCAICGLGPFWQGKSLVLVLDHINGVNNDHRLSNLRLLCPNCNAQCTTFCGKNKSTGGGSNP